MRWTQLQTSVQVYATQYLAMQYAGMSVSVRVCSIKLASGVSVFVSISVNKVGYLSGA